MNHEERSGDGHGFEEQMRELLTEDACALRPSAVPYAAIRRQGIAERRRRLATAGAALVALAAAPVGAYALNGPDGGGGDTAAPRPPVAATVSGNPAKSPAGAPKGPGRPATEGQLLDGITYEQAASALRDCIALDKAYRVKGSPRQDLGRASDYRLLLGMRSTGDSNAPGDGFFVVGVKEQPRSFRLICSIREGAASGVNSGTVDVVPGAGPVAPDMNGRKLYSQSILGNGDWKLPFRWGSIGTVEESVDRVTVSYGGRTSEAALDHGWFAATGELTEQVTKAPRIKGYGKGGELVYDSDQDPSYEKTVS
ncbi:hypothetical protein [Streptomyces sp. NPDC093094]|uniref:hypothetical protein n=1 Tax=Streptomyces sp. NPDC093094 TaxID=3366026 RepID=UPI0037F7973C